MKTPRLISTLLYCVLSAPLISYAGETIYFDGSDDSLLRQPPSWILSSPYALFSNISVANNNVTVSGGLIRASVYGGVSPDDISDLDVSNNRVVVTGGEVWGDVLGGHSNMGATNNNTLIIGGNSSISNIVYGGYSLYSSASFNHVVLGESANAWQVQGGESSLGDVIANQVDVSGQAEVRAEIIGGITYDGRAVDNTVTFSGESAVGYKIVGGLSMFNESTGNRVIISGGRFTQPDPEWNYVAGGMTEELNTSVTNNHVDISGGYLNASVYGGYVYIIPSAFMQTSEEVVISGNSVSVSGGTVTGPIYGGAVNTIFSAQIINNKVTLSNNPVFSETSTWLRGGHADTITSGDLFSGNNLVVLNPMTSSVAGIENFQYYRFMISPTYDRFTPMLSAGIINLTDPMGGRVATVDGLAIKGGGDLLKSGDSFLLLHSTTPMTGDYVTNRVVASRGFSLAYEFEVTQSDDKKDLVATVLAPPQVIPQSKSFSEGRAAGLGFLTQGGDIISNHGMQSLQTAVNQSVTGSSSFGVIEGSSQKIKTGSHVDIKGVSMLVGIASKNIFNYQDLSAGAFVEAGWGNYDSYNSFSNAPSIHGYGDSNYYGVGLMSRLEMPMNWYVDGTLRVGRLDSDFDSRDLQNSLTGQYAHYDSKSTYTGLSFGVGKTIDLDENQSFELYGRYSWTHVNSDTTIISEDHFNFDSTDSQRLRFGMRYVNQTNTTYRFYSGLAYDYDFSGDVKGNVDGFSMSTPSLKGGTGVIELGVTLRPQHSNSLHIDIGVQGYVGQREGVAGSMKVIYVF